MSLILDNNVWARFTQTNVIVGLVLLAFGILLAVSASWITRLKRKSEKIKTNDRVFLTIKAFALAIILASLIVMIVE